jgi:hypothetical protein
METDDAFLRRAAEKAIERARERLRRRLVAIEGLEKAPFAQRERAEERLEELNREMQHLPPWGHLVRQSLMAYASPGADVLARIAAHCAEQLGHLLTRAVNWTLSPPRFATAPAPSSGATPRPAMAPRMEMNFEPERRRL